MTRFLISVGATVKKKSAPPINHSPQAHEEIRQYLREIGARSLC